MRCRHEMQRRGIDPGPFILFSGIFVFILKFLFDFFRFCLVGYIFFCCWFYLVVWFVYVFCFDDAVLCLVFGSTDLLNLSGCDRHFFKILWL